MRRRQSVLFLVVGPSGVGKDSLMDGARRILTDEADFHFPRRLITRPEEAGGEDHQAVTVSEFEDLEAAGGLMLSWTAHGHHYGIPKSAEQALLDGSSVIVNVSRQVIDQARQHWSPVRVLLITASSSVLRDRLIARGRETADDIQRRLDRAEAYRISGSDVHEVLNDDRLDRAIERFVAVIERETAAAANGRRTGSVPSV